MSGPSHISEAEVQAYADRQLSEERRAAVEEWLLSHADDAARVAAYRLLGERWRAAYAPVLDEPVPAVLLETLQKQATAQRAARVRRGAIAVAAAVILGAAALWQVWERAPHFIPASDANVMVQRAAIAHIVYAAEMPQPPATPVGKAELLAQLSERLGMKVEAPELDTVGMSFLGGRLLPGDHAPAALLMYQTRSGRRVSVYWGPEFRRERETSLISARGESGTRVFYWLDHECGYAVASSDLDEKKLARVARLAYAQLEK